MSGFTFDNQLAEDATGQANWDVDVNGNMSIIERGYHFQGQAGAAINSGDVCLVNSAGYVVPFDPRSPSNFLTQPVMSWQQVSSGSNATFLLHGIVRSMGVWSGQLIPGQPVFVSAQSPGFVVNSYAGISLCIGWALGSQAVRFNPHNPRITPERVTQAASVGPVLVGSYGDFSFTPGYRGIVRVMSIGVQSCDNWKLEFFTGSARSAGLLAYQTAVQSGTKGQFTGVTTLNFTDAAMFPWLNTDTSSPALMFGRLSVLSGSTVNSSNFSLSLEMERFL